MESESLIADGAGRAAKTSYNAAPAAAPDSGPKFTRKTIFGDVRNWRRFAWFEWVFVAVASLTILTILGVSIQRFVYFQQHFTNISVLNSSDSDKHSYYHYYCSNWTCTNDFIFTVVLVLNIAFSALYVVHGLLQERMFALVAYSVTVVVIMLYVIVNYSTKGERDSLLEPLRLVLHHCAGEWYCSV
ncbi:hypothetical protein GBAR_LOCUS10695 [Geodia barretti]|uniref:DUF7789 domain-containing protein n=1 Tax=Geodia barretti TaxID=519541 RepID=A0AA35RTY3_GEOBA|nr:hypothetical protein GBAR_LOCUS10695 [Geodia barretti]